MHRILAVAHPHVTAAATNPYLGWTERHVLLLVAILVILMLWRLGGSILWHLVEAVAIGYIVVPRAAIPQTGTISSKVASGSVVGPTGTPLFLLLIVAVMFVGTLVLVLRKRGKIKTAMAAAEKAAAEEEGGK